MDHNSPFQHAENGMTRFPPNIEQIDVGRGINGVWLRVRRNETVLKFPLGNKDVEHLIVLLNGALPMEA